MTVQVLQDSPSPTDSNDPRSVDDPPGRGLDPGPTLECAMQLWTLGRREEATQLCRVLVAHHPREVGAQLLLGRLAYAADRYEEAARAFGAAVSLNPSAAAHHGFGTALHARGFLPRAIAQYRAALLCDPNLSTAHLNLAGAYAAQTRLDEALQAYRDALRLDPMLAEAHYGLGKTLAIQHEADRAEHEYHEALRLRPGYLKALLALGNLLRERGRFQEAAEHYEMLLKQQPDHAEARCGLGHTHLSLGNVQIAEHHYRTIVRQQPAHVEAHLGLAGTLESFGKIEEALEHNRAARRLDPERIDTLAGEASLLEKQKRYQEAYALIEPILERSIESSTPGVGHILLVAARLARRVGNSEIIPCLERALDNMQLPADIRMNLHFALGRLCDEAGDADRAFEHFARGNAMKPAHFDHLLMDRHYDALIHEYRAEFMRTAPRAMRRSVRPIFIVGMPRSGTSLVEQILASHPDVAGGGELLDIGQLVLELPKIMGTEAPHPEGLKRLEIRHLDEIADRYLRRLDEISAAALRVTDKMPHNFQYLGLIALAFPDARIIHCVRHPLDTCLSCYIQNFGARHDYAYRLEDMAVHYRQYQRLMCHWQGVVDIPILDVSYEALVTNPEQESRRLIDFAGLPWDASCLQFHESKRFVATASYDQVRRPIYRDAVERWRRYERHLGPLLKGLDLNEVESAVAPW